MARPRVITKFNFLVVLALLPSVCIHAESKKYTSQKVPGFSFLLPDGWVVSEENFVQDSASRVGVLTFWITPKPLNYTYETLPPLLKAVYKPDTYLPEMVLQIRIEGIGNPEPWKDQAASASALLVNSVPQSMIRHEDTKIANRDIRLNYTLIHDSGPDPYYVTEGAAPGTPFIYVNAMAPQLYESSAKPQFDAGFRQILASFQIPDPLLADPPKTTNPHNQGLFGNFMLIIGGLYYIISVGFLLAVTGAPLIKKIRRDYEHQYVYGSALVIFYLLYAQLMFFLLGSAFAAVFLVGEFLSRLSSDLPDGGMQKFIDSLSTGCLIALSIATGTFITVVLRAQLFGRLREGHSLSFSSETEKKLLRWANNLISNSGRIPFSKISITASPEMWIASSWKGQTTLFLGLPILMLLSEGDLTLALIHEASHTDDGGLLFYQIIRIVTTKMNVQAAKFEDAERTFTKDEPGGFRDPNTGMDWRPLINLVSLGAIWIEKKTLRPMLKAIVQLGLTPIMWQHEIRCDARAAQHHKEKDYARALLHVAVIQYSWKLSELSERQVTTTNGLLELYCKNWHKGVMAVSLALDRDSQCNGHPPLSQRLALLGIPRGEQQLLLDSLPVPEFDHQKDWILTGLDQTHQRRDASRSAFQLIRVREAGLLPFDL